MKNISKILILFVIAFVLGGVFVADQQGTSLWAVLTGDEKPPIVEMDKTEDNITASLPLDQGAMTVAEIVEKASPAVVNIKAKVQVSSMADNPFFNDPFSGNSSATSSGMIPARATKPGLARVS